MAEDHKTHRWHDRHSQQYHEDIAKNHSDDERLHPESETQLDSANGLQGRFPSTQRRVPSALRPELIRRSVSDASRPSHLKYAESPMHLNVMQPDDQESQPRRRSWASVMTPNPTAGSTRPPSVTTDSMGEKPFGYLDLQSDEIRLVRISPVRMTTMRCTIEYASLDKVPEYVAISYAWGDAGDQESIYLDGAKKFISASLFGALSALRNRDKEVLVWADALCINQQNMVEKSSQIGLMTKIYKKAKSVAVWLGPEADNSRSALTFLDRLKERDKTSPGDRSRSWTISHEDEKNLAAVARLFSRSYWRRLWVVQEVFNAADIDVYCGKASISWRALNEASSALHAHQSDLYDHFAKISSHHHVQTIFNEGPRSLLDPEEVHVGEKVLLDVLRRCRRKVSDKPQDKVFGLLGVLPEAIQKDFPLDYTRSVKEVFTDVVDFLVHTTSSLDVICESIDFSEHSNPANLPSWVPDWSHNPILKSLSSSYGFSASQYTPAEFIFQNHRNELQISAIYLDTVEYYGVSVGTQCTLADYLMAFLHWRALLVQTFGRIKQGVESKRKHEEFCRILNLDQDPSERPSDEWMQASYHVFSSLIQERLPFLEIDSELRPFAKARTFVHRSERRQFLQDNFGEHMMGRAFCITGHHRIGMGSGAMLAGDIIVVPFGCRTPVILRADPFSPSKYRLVGDIYIDRYMRGRAMEKYQLEPQRRRNYVLI